MRLGWTEVPTISGYHWLSDRGRLSIVDVQVEGDYYTMNEGGFYQSFKETRVPGGALSHLRFLKIITPKPPSLTEET